MAREEVLPLARSCASPANVVRRGIVRASSRVEALRGPAWWDRLADTDKRTARENAASSWNDAPQHPA